MVHTVPLPNVDISVVIPVRNDARRLRDCLESLSVNDYPRERVEVIVVDNGSTDNSAAIARTLGCTVLTNLQGPVSALRNFGAAVARGAILAYIDADHS